MVVAGADGETPISGGLVRVARCADPTRPLRQAGGVRAERTNTRGRLALLDFKDLPGCIVATVAGGKVNGRTLRGVFRAEAHDQRGRIMSVLATPVSTLTYRVKQARPGLSTAAATRRVKRLLGIPRHFDDIDLSSDDTPFDGDRYTRAAVRAGGVARLNKSLIRNGRTRRFPAANTSAASQSSDPLLDLADQFWRDNDVDNVIKDGLTSFGASIALDLAGAGGRWVLGRLLDEWGLKDAKDFLLPKPDTQKIIEMIEDLNRRVNNLQATADKILQKVTEVKYEVLLAPAKNLVNDIKTVQFNVLNLAKSTPDEPRVGPTKKILRQIEDQLEPKRYLLDDLLTPGGDGGVGILRAASEKASQGRFFTPEDSQSIQAVYQYFAVNQMRLASLLVEYWNTLSCSKTPQPQDCLSPTSYIRPNFDRFEPKMIDKQRKLLKPPVPAGTFIDTRTMRMWPLRSWSVNGAEALKTVAVWQGMRCTGTRNPTCTGSAFSPYPLPLVGSTSRPTLGPWSDWHFPTEDDYKGLIQDWTGTSALEWLNQKTAPPPNCSGPCPDPPRPLGFRTSRMGPEWKADTHDKSREDGHLWMSTSFRMFSSGMYVYRANISEADEPGPHVWYKHAGNPREREDRDRSFHPTDSTSGT